ncbi:hypothetical protein ACJX0J_016896 [Zea mays]
MIVEPWAYFQLEASMFGDGNWFLIPIQGVQMNTILNSVCAIKLVVVLKKINIRDIWKIPYVSSFSWCPKPQIPHPMLEHLGDKP